MVNHICMIRICEKKWVVSQIVNGNICFSVGKIYLYFSLTLRNIQINNLLRRWTNKRTGSLVENMLLKIEFWTDWGSVSKKSQEKKQKKVVLIKYIQKNRTLIGLSVVTELITASISQVVLVLFFIYWNLRNLLQECILYDIWVFC